MSDETTLTLLERVRGGDREALNALYCRYAPRVLAAVRLRLGAELRKKVESWDVLQEVMLESLKQVEQFDPRNEGALLNWLGQIALNRIRDAHAFHHAQRRDMQREQPLRKMGLEEETHRVFPPADGPSPSELLILGENIEQLERALDRLSPEERELIIARKIEEQSFVDLGQHFGLSTDAVRMRFNRALAKLVEEFRQLEELSE